MAIINCCSHRTITLINGYMHVILTVISLIAIIFNMVSPDHATPESGDNVSIKLISTVARTMILIILLIILTMTALTIIGAIKEKKMYLIPFMSLQFTSLIFSIPWIVGVIMVFVAVKIPSGLISLFIFKSSILIAIESLLLKATWRYYRQSQPDTIHLINDHV